MKNLGKITQCEIGWGGYQEQMLGLSLYFQGDGFAIGDYRGTWGHERPKDAKWTEASRDKHFSDVVKFIGKMLTDAKKENLSEMIGVPVEVETEGCGGKLISWRVLTEVL